MSVSRGGRMANLVLPVEPRFKAAVIHVGGLESRFRTLPEVDYFNFVGRVRTPVLMLNGRYDMQVPLETEALPMFRLLGTAEADKRQVVVDTDHKIPRPELVRETLAWLDEYLGPVEAPAASR